MSTTQARPHLDGLSSLRYFAAVYVFLFHSLAMKVVDRLPAPHWFQYFCGLGYIAVSFFFVLSGFVLVYGYGDREIKDWWKFMRARFARIYPAYLLGLFFTSGFFFMINLFDVPDFRWFARHQVITVITQVTMTQAWIPQAALGWNMPGWAVSVFMAYYAIFPWVSRKMRQMSTGAMFALVAVAWVCSVAVAVGYQVIQPDGVAANTAQVALPWLNFVKFHPVMRVSEFLMGMAVGYAVLRGAPSLKRAGLSAVAGLGLLAALIAVGGHVPYVVMHTGLAAPAFALVIYGLSVPSKWSAWLCAKPMTALGDASLNFYLLHSMWIGIIFQFRETGPQVPVTWTRFAITLAVSIAISLALYRWWETPARKKFDPVAKAKPKVAELATAS